MNRRLPDTSLPAYHLPDCKSAAGPRLATISAWQSKLFSSSCEAEEELQHDSSKSQEAEHEEWPLASASAAQVCDSV